ncbi:MAG: RagB/SusD family nutrient uptake outer membrane protein [Breznakibacter sp.]
MIQIIVKTTMSYNKRGLDAHIKRFKSVLLGVLIIVPWFHGCDVLDVESEDSIPASEAFKDKKGIEKGILGSYDAMQSLSYYGRSFSILPDLSSDDLLHPDEATSTDYAEVANNAILPENSSVEGIWNAIYNTVNTANSVVVKVPEMSDMTDDEKSKALGELYFIRALCHFNLVNLFGAVPIKTEPTVGTSQLDVARDSVADVYEQIIDDLTFAEQHLSVSASTKTRATVYAATALLARVYLYNKQYDLAYEKANEVIVLGGYTLLPSVAAVFADDGSAETIFEIDFTSDDRNRVAEYNLPKTLNGRYEVAPTESLAGVFENGDTRSEASVAMDGANVYANKYIDLKTGADNVVVLRLSEMYLIRAEALARSENPVVKDIQDDVNAVRNRSGLGDTPASTVAGLIDAIARERRVELAFEGHRWFDLVRTGKAVGTISGLTDKRMTLYPIPSSEVLTNKLMKQNPGY